MIIVTEAERSSRSNSVAPGRIVVAVELVLDTDGLADLLHLAEREGWQNWNLIQEAV